MFKNYFKIAVRNLTKNKAFSLINIFGLAIGLTCFMFMAAFVFNELSYDKYPAQARNIYRVILSVTGNGDLAAYPMVDVAVGEGMKNAFPEIKATTRLAPVTDFIKYNDKQFKEEKIAFADSNFLQMFCIPLIEGDTRTALVQPNSLVVSSAFAKKYFGNEDAVGKSLSVGTVHQLYKVTGVFGEIPENSHFHFDAFLSLTSWHLTRQTWSNVGFYTYLLLNKNTDPKNWKRNFLNWLLNMWFPKYSMTWASAFPKQKNLSTHLYFHCSLLPIFIFTRIPNMNWNLTATFNMCIFFQHLPCSFYYWHV
jgi:putative ABC transport system permease protein